MKVADLKDKKILILGFAREGIATLKFLNKHLPNQKISIADKTSEDNLTVEAAEALKSGNVGEKYFRENYLDKVAEFEVVIKSPGITYRLPQLQEAIKKGVNISSSTILFFDNCPAPVIGVTGTKGKSTTSSLIYEVLKAGGKDVTLLGNIGKPAISELDNIKQDSLIVFELSSFQLYNLKKSPHIAVITNIYPEHLDYYLSFDGYVDSKAIITLNQAETDLFVYNNEHELLIDIASKTKAKKMPFNKADIPNHLIPKDFKLASEFLINTVPAYLIGKIYGLTNAEITQGFANFTPLPHRLEPVGKVKDIFFYNDSLSTVPETTIAALDALGEDVETLIAGGFDRGIDFTKLGERIAKSKVKNLILFPATGRKIWQELVKADPNSKIQRFDVENMRDAVKTAFETTPPGKICLLSPASTSFNLFENFADRGDQFKRNILEQ